MTSRERLIAASRGQDLDCPPTLSWLSALNGADGHVIAFDEDCRAPVGNELVLADVPNPFGLALRRGINLNQVIRDDPEGGGALLDRLSDEVSRQIRFGLDRGADGIFYRLHGATPTHCSPMQYGGCYLERDRELLLQAKEATLNVLFVAGREELYVDFVSDLPTHVFAWDAGLSRHSVEQVKHVRTGPVAADDPTSDIRLIIGSNDYLETLEQPTGG